MKYTGKDKYEIYNNKERGYYLCTVSVIEDTQAVRTNCLIG